MYIPKHFESTDPAWCHDLIRREPFATLVSAGSDGVPFATHLPVLLDPSQGPLGTLHAHVARPNPHWQLFGPGRQALVVFQGAHTYVSPSWYAKHPSVPTWNYVAVHAYGVPRVIEEAARVQALLARLVHAFEDGRPEPWRMEDLTPSYLEGMMRGLVAFEIPIDRLEGKAKLSQNRPAGDRARVQAALRSAGDPWSQGVASLMLDRADAGPDPA